MENQQTMIEKINKLGVNRTPFFLVVDFEMKNPQLFLMDELEDAQIQFSFPGHNTTNALSTEHRIELQKHPVEYEAYLQKFNIVKAALHYGNSFLTNLTCETNISTGASLDDIFKYSRAKYKVQYKNQWVCFSPETFVQLNDGFIYSYPMKGTIDADLPNAEQQLLQDAKEIAEHYTIVDLIRNDLSMVASDVKVNRFRYIDRINTSGKTLLQASSEISGKLPDDYLNQLGTMLFTLLPAGSISGAPKKKTIEIIKEAEQYQRGFYTGTAFYFDGSTLDSCVLIRFIEQKTSHQLVYKSGGGITIHSEPEKEYQELIDKIYVPGI